MHMPNFTVFTVFYKCPRLTHRAATLKLVQVVQEREGVLQLPAGQGEPRDGARAARGHGGGRPVQHELRHPLPAGAGQHRQVATRDIT